MEGVTLVNPVNAGASLEQQLIQQLMEGKQIVF
jgi:hypothetical protein